MKIIRDAKTGLYMRENTLDEYVIREQTSYSGIFANMKDKVVLDIGGNIGAFAYNCMQNGAKRVYSFEPDPDNIKMFKKQKLKNVKLYEYAVFNRDGKAKFYKNIGKNKGLHSLRKTQGRECITVNTMSFEKILKKTNPDIIKIDIEGGEYYIDMELILNTNIEYIAIEIHLTQKENYDKGIELIRFLQKNFKQLNSYIDISKKITSWTKVFVGARNE